MRCAEGGRHGLHADVHRLCDLLVRQVVHVSQYNRGLLTRRKPSYTLPQLRVRYFRRQHVLLADPERSKQWTAPEPATQIVERDGLGPGARGSHGTDCLPPLKGAGKRIVGRLSRSIQVPSQSNTGRQDPRALPSITVLKLGHYTPYKSPGPQNHQCPRQILPSCASPALLRAGLVPARESAWSIDRHAVAPLPVGDELPPSYEDYEGENDGSRYGEHSLVSALVRGIEATARWRSGRTTVPSSVGGRKGTGQSVSDGGSHRCSE